MKRNFTDSSVRSTAGCLPVPLFNQKKRNRQPLTSNPFQNELGLAHSADNFDFSAMLADFGWDTAKPEGTLRSHCDTAKPEPAPSQRTRGPEQEEKSAGRNIWKKQDFPAFGRGRENRTPSLLEDRTESFVGAAPLKTGGQQRAPQSSKAAVAESGYGAAGQQRQEARNSLSRGPQRQNASYTFKQNLCQPKAPEKTASPVEGKWIGSNAQKRPADPAKPSGKDRTLRIIPAVIAGMKHWSQYADKTLLLFEVLGILDSAVTPGAYSAKTFQLRDGNESVQCVFYEIDRELPRLIRGRVHRCMGSYDATRKVFRCVSVRPATAAEQQTFQDFVRAADTEMAKYVKMSNEV